MYKLIVLSMVIAYASAGIIGGYGHGLGYAVAPAPVAVAHAPLAVAHAPIAVKAHVATSYQNSNSLALHATPVAVAHAAPVAVAHAAPVVAHAAPVLTVAHGGLGYHGLGLGHGIGLGHGLLH